jgi:glycosyltransferase involved in cell wall biosynthesis
MAEKVKVSIILTSYNHEKYLPEAIDSVLNQTFTNFELIVWDDNSADDSWHLINQYSDPRIRAFRNAETKRGIWGINRAISEFALGEYIAIHHSDDLWEPEKLQKQVDFLDAHPEIGAVFTWTQVIDDNGANLPENWFIQDNRSQWQWLRQFFQGENHLNHPSVLIRKICYQEVGLYRFGLAQTGDAEMWMRLLLKYPIHIIQERLTKHRLVLDKSNTSGGRPETRIRLQYEFYKLMQNYLKIASFNDLVNIFPSAEKYYQGEETDIHFALAMALLEEKSSSSAQLFGLDILFEIISDPIHAANIERLYDFDYQGLIALTGKHDVFSQNAILQRDGQIANLNQAIVERDGQVASLNQAIVERDGQIAGLNQAIVERDGQIAGLNQAMVEYNGQVASLNQAMVEYNGQVASLNQAIVERDGQVASLNQAAAALKIQLDTIYSSKAWHFVQMLRKIRNRIIGHSGS